MLKKTLAIFLAALLAATLIPALGQELTQPRLDSLTVGNPTPMRGDFFTNMWGNITSDIDVRLLLHGYDLILWNGVDGKFTVDPSVVSGLVTTVNQAGDHTYTMALYDDLYWSDGTRITAWDYAFSLLLRIAPQIRELGGNPYRAAFIEGYGPYVEGTAKALSGVRVLSDAMLSITISHEYLPFFYEMGLLSTNPYPISVIAPGVAVRDDGEGVYLANASGEGEPLFTADLLRKTILDERTGYRSHPSVVSGPYTLVSWDGVTAEFAVNPMYKGNENGVRPSIPRLVYTAASNGDMIEKLKAGEFGLLNKVTDARAITAGQELVQEGAFNMVAYPRVGLSYVSFACEKDTVSSQAVRQAIAWSMDRDALNTGYTGDFGLRVDGYYGLGQWMYRIISGAVEPPVEPPEDETDTAAAAEYEKTLAEWNALELSGLTAYQVDADRAAALLDADGWTVNDEGIRVREADGKSVALDLNMLCPEGNRLAEDFAAGLAENLKAIGIRLTVHTLPMNELITQYYDQSGREADMYYLASNFDMIFDPAAGFLTGADDAHTWSVTGCADEPLYALALDMNATEPGDTLSYMHKWIAFQQRFNEVLPMIPVYSNVYFDFFGSVLREYNVAEDVAWSGAIVSAYLSEEAPAAETTEEDVIFD